MSFQSRACDFEIDRILEISGVKFAKKKSANVDREVKKVNTKAALVLFNIRERLGTCPV